MKRRRAFRLLTVKRWIPLLAGGLALQFNLTGCDTEVRNTVLGGIETSLTGMIDSVIAAFFLALQDSGSSTSQPVVKAVFENLTTWLA